MYAVTLPIRAQRPFALYATRRERVSLDTGAHVGWTVADRAELHRAVSSARHGRGIVSIPVMEPLGDLPGLVLPLLTALGVAPAAVELSISAHRLACCDIATLVMLSELRDAGLGLAVAGLRGHQLGLLARLPLSGVILDPGLVSCLPDRGEALDEVEAIVTAAQAIGVSVVAPGIELEAQRAVLATLGVQHGEGELFEPG